jgi:hypothetical protein
MMSAASHDEIVRVIGEVDDQLIERLAQTGATLDEIAEAWALLASVRAPSPSCAPRLVELRAILEQAALEDDDDGWACV